MLISQYINHFKLCNTGYINFEKFKNFMSFSKFTSSATMFMYGQLLG